VLVLLGTLIRILGILLLLRLLLRAFASWRRAPVPESRDAGTRDLVRDRVCNTFLPRERALRGLVGGREEYFCSTACRDRGLREGARSLAAP
jgi:hypothetical protein